MRPDLINRVERARAFNADLKKTLENRTWATRHRGHSLIHASKGMTRVEYEDVCRFLPADEHLRGLNAMLPLPKDLPRGGIEAPGATPAAASTDVQQAGGLLINRSQVQHHAIGAAA